MMRKGLCRKAALAEYAGAAVARQPAALRALARALPPTVVVDVMAAFHGGGGGGGSTRPGGRAEALAWALADAEAAIAAAPAGARWILKPSLANKAAGIAIVDGAAAAAAHVCDPALRGVGVWVLQRYVARPLTLRGRKFHLRVYVLADGDLRVHVFRQALALSAAAAYDAAADPAAADARAHITNPCAGAAHADFDEAAVVACLSDLPAELAARSGGSAAAGRAQAAAIYARICAVVAELFAALRTQPASYAPLANAFEIYGADFLVEDGDESTRDADGRGGSGGDAGDDDAAVAAGLHVRLLEFNPTPDIAQSGTRLEHVIAAMLEGVLRIAVDARFPPPAPHPQAPPRRTCASRAELASAWAAAAEGANSAQQLLEWDCVLDLQPRPGGPCGMTLTEP